ncbi:MAG: winged helix-turn-helix domain-containing protein, partial [Flavobacteriales bacterium]
NGLEICREIREKNLTFPIIMLTARTEEEDKVKGLELGADDYITKPFGIREFLARVKAVCRRFEKEKVDASHEPQEIFFRELQIDKAKRIVILQQKRLELTPKEFDLLYLLASNKGVTYDRKKLLNLVWGYDFEGYEHTVNTHINRLRAKIEKDPNQPEYVLTTWGVGYRFNDEA